MVLIWFGASLYYLTLFDPAPIVVQLAITVAIYPLIAELFGLLQRRMLR